MKKETFRYNFINEKKKIKRRPGKGHGLWVCKGRKGREVNKCRMKERELTVKLEGEFPSRVNPRVLQIS